MSIGTVFRLWALFVCVPNEREKVECLCQVCLNVRLLCNALMCSVSKSLQRVFSSITDYFSNGKVCNTARNGYPSFNCINGDCTDCNGIINPYNYELKNNDTVTCYQFECKETGKVKNGKPSKRTQRVDYSVVTTVACKEKLNGMAKSYMLHRYDVAQDKSVWPSILNQCRLRGEHIVQMDYSENIQEKPKFEAQSAHFSGQQHSLHYAGDESAENNIYSIFQMKKNMIGVTRNLYWKIYWVPYLNISISLDLKLITAAYNLNVQMSLVCIAIYQSQQGRLLLLIMDHLVTAEV